MGLFIEELGLRPCMTGPGKLLVNLLRSIALPPKGSDAEHGFRLPAISNQIAHALKVEG
jgi:hypothetical protein